MQVKIILKTLFCLGIFLTGFSLYEAGLHYWPWGFISSVAIAALLLISDPDEYITIPEGINVYVFRALNTVFCVGVAFLSFWSEIYSILGVSMGFLAVALYPSFKVEGRE